MIKAPSPDEVAAEMSDAGGWTKATLAKWGVPWPPPKGWRAKLRDQWKQQQSEPAMTTTRESVRNAIVAELKLQASDMARRPPFAIFTNETDKLAAVRGHIDLDALADAVVEHVA